MKLSFSPFREVASIGVIAGVLLFNSPLQSQEQSKSFVVVPNNLSSSSVGAQFKDVVREVQRTGQTNLKLNVPAVAGGATNTVSGTVSPSLSAESALYDAVFTDAVRLKTAADQIAKIVSNEPANRRSVLYDLQQKYQNVERSFKIVVPQNISDFVTTAATVDFNTKIQMPATAEPLAVNEKVASVLKQASESPGNWFDAKSAQFMASTSVLETAASRSAAAVPLSKAYANVVSLFMKAVAAPADKNAVKGYVDAAAMFKANYATQWPVIKNDAVARQAAAEAYNGLEKQRVLKAQYGALTNFSPLSYEQVFYFSRHVVALRDGSGIFCSGIALSRQWIASAGHCFANRSWSDVRVSFDLDGLGRASRPLQILDQWPEPAPGASGSDNIDFTFVRVEEDQAVTMMIADLEARVDAQPYGAEPLCLRSIPVTYRQPVFGVGHPMGGAKTVHDYAYVWFPHKIDEELYNRMGSEIFAHAYKVEQQLRRTSYAEAVKKDFELSYSKIALEGGKTYHYYFDRGLGSALRPSFGIDTDTFGGDSGSPIFDRQTRCIVGIFSGGQRDTLGAPEASWREHEIAAPISEVLKRLRATDRAQSLNGRQLDEGALAARDELLSRLTEITDIR